MKEVIVEISADCELVEKNREVTAQSSDLHDYLSSSDDDFVTPVSSFEIESECSREADTDAQEIKKPWWITKFLFK